MRIIDTYVFKENDIVNCMRNVGLNTKYKRRDNGELREYTKENVVDTILKLVEKKRITKGKKIENKKSNYTTYVFNYTVSKEDTNEKHAYKIKIPNNHLEENKKYVDRLNLAVTSSIAIRTVNYIKTAAIGTTFAAGLIVGGIYYLTKPIEKTPPEPPRSMFDSFDNTLTHQEFIDRMRENGITDEEMKSWGVELEEEQEETKPFHQ